MKLPSTLPRPFRDAGLVVSWIADLTGQPEASVRARLRVEFDRPGSSVATALRDAGLSPHTWNDDLIRFYGETDAFLYELVIWNRNRLKRRMRGWIGRHLAGAFDGPADVLSVGDGIGFDSAYLAMAGHRVTYFEVAGHAEAFARRVFAVCDVHVTTLTQQTDIPEGAYDVVVCLDVLEHVPDPPAMVEALVGYLRPGGRLIVHAPFYMIHPSNATHLKSNRRYSGDLSLYERRGLALVDGEPTWTPLVLVKRGAGAHVPHGLDAKRAALRAAGWYLRLGRYSAVPFGWVDAYRRRKGCWFDSTAAPAPGRTAPAPM